MRVVVVGTNRMCHEHLHRHGHELVLLIPRRKARPGDTDPHGPYRHVVVLDDDTKPLTWVSVARALHEDRPFDAVAAFNEHTYRIVHAISRDLDLPTTVDVDLFERVLNKSTMRDILGKHDLAGCRHRLAHGRSEVIASIAHIGMPCIVKPVDGEASLGVSRVESAADIEPALARLGPSHIDRGVVVEEFLVGEEFSVEAISVGGKHHILAVTKKFADPNTFVERGHLVPAPLVPAVRDVIVDYTTRVLDALGFHDCPSHTEMVLTAAGPRLVETHNRIGGDRIMDLVRLASGVDPDELVARQSLAEDITPLLPDPVAYHQYAAVWYADPSGPASNELAEVRGLDRLRTLSHVERVELLREPGSRQTEVRQSGDRSARVITVADTPDEAVHRAQAAVRMLDFVYVWKPAD